MPFYGGVDWDELLRRTGQRNKNAISDYEARGLPRGGVNMPSGGFPGHSRTTNSLDLGGIGDILRAPSTVFLGGANKIPGSGSIDPGAQYIPNTTLGGVAGGASAPGGGGDDLFSQLLGLVAGNQGSINQEDLVNQARSAVNAQYDPQIAELRRAMAAAQTRAGRNKTELGNMFGSLSNSFNADIPVIEQNYAQGSQGIKKQYDQLQQQITSSYNDVDAQQQALMERLNLQAASPDITKQQNTDEAFLQGQQGQAEQDTLDALKLLQTGATDFTRQGAEISRMEGTQRQGDLMTQLEDYLAEATGKVGDLGAAKNQAYQSALADLMQQAQAGQADQQNTMFSRLADIIRLQQSQERLELDRSRGAGAAGGASDFKEGPLAASQYLSGASPQNAQGLNSFLLQVLQRPEFTSGKTGGLFNGEQQNLTPEAAAQIAQQQAAAAGMSPQEQQQVYLAMLAYYGRLY